MNTVFIGSIAPGISNAVMEKLLKVRKRGGEGKTKHKEERHVYLGGFEICYGTDGIYIFRAFLFSC